MSDDLQEFLDECPLIRTPEDVRTILEELVSFSRWLDVLAKRGQFYQSLARFEKAHEA